MIFSNSFFIFTFLPVVLLGYYVMRPWRWMQNFWLALSSLFFYAWGEPQKVVLMVLSIIMNYGYGLLVDRFRGRRIVVRLIMILMIISNLSVLFVFKYMNFILGIFGVSSPYGELELPIGISFYTFQAISYVVDVYRKNGEPQKNPLNVALYIAFFPQLIAGPIVRYQTIADQIKNRKETWSDFSAGVERFIIGLSKKLILANSFAPIADYAFGHVSEMSSGSAWIGILCYTLQIYFDFSGYSDMAIGLGKMFGFHFLENFNYPYVSASVSEFWRRWHISLGSWFRDYIYIPMGGSRVKSRGRLIFNLFVVWTFTGIWHGANWTFLFWGLWYFLILVFEKVTDIPNKMQSSTGKVIYRIFTLICVMLGWVLFRAESLGAAVSYMEQMFLARSGVWDKMAAFWMKDLWLLLVAGIAASTPLLRYVRRYFGKGRGEIVLETLRVLIYLGLFFVCISYSVNSSYNPFIYFNF